MKTTQLNQLRKKADALIVFGDAENVSTIKQVLKIENTLNKIDNLTTKDIVDKVLSDYRFLFNRLPKNIKGVAKQQFCDAVRNVIAINGSLFAIDKGEVITDRVINKLNKRNNPELFNLLSNLIQDAARDVDTTIKIDAAVETMNELLNEFAKVA